MARFKSSDLVPVGISQIRARVDRCKPEAIDYMVRVADEMRYGLHEDKTIDEKLFEKYKKDLYDEIERFKKDCNCSMIIKK